MKIYTMSTKSHDFMYQEILRTSIKENEPSCEIILHEYSQICLSGNYYDTGWRELMEKKIDIYLEAVSSEDPYFIWSDVDIEFYQPFIDECIKELDDYDIAFQNGVGPSGEKEYCAGFFICKVNAETKSFFQHLKNIYKQYPCDQEAINHNIQLIKAKTLSNKFFNISEQYREWTGQDLSVPKDTIMSHANYTIGAENKLKLLLKIKNAIQQYKKNKIKFLSAEYGVFEDVTDVIQQTDKTIINIIQSMQNYNLPIDKKYLYLYDNNYKLLNQPIKIIR
jgi:hypothetical protein